MKREISAPSFKDKIKKYLHFQQQEFVVYQLFLYTFMFVFPLNFHGHFMGIVIQSK
jgi:hypothetical protein